MNRTERTDRKYRELFGGSPVREEGPDAEFVRILQRFIFGEVSYVGSLNSRDRELVTVTVLVAVQALPQLQAHVGACLQIGLSPTEIREAVYQCAPFVGFPRTLNAISAMNAAFRERGVSLLPDCAEPADEETRYSRGLAVQEDLYGSEIAERYSWLPEPFGKEIPKWLTELCFGDFATRKGLDRKRRELLIVVLLAAMGGTEPQIRSHVLGALKSGNTREEIVCAWAHAMPYMGMPRLLNALNAAKDVMEGGTTDERTKL